MKYIKSFESLNNGLQYNVSETELITHGYKLYEWENKCYIKKLAKTSITYKCWTNEQKIEICDYGDDTINIVKYILENINNPEKIYKTKSFDDFYMIVYFNIDTKVFVNKKDILNDNTNFEDFLMSDYETDPDIWSKIMIFQNTWCEIMEELIFLTQGEIKKLPHYDEWQIHKDKTIYNI